MAFCLPRAVIRQQNPSLVRRALERLDRVLGSDQATRAHVLEDLAGDPDELIADLIEGPDDINGEAADG